MRASCLHGGYLDLLELVAASETQASGRVSKALSVVLDRRCAHALRYRIRPLKAL